MKNSNLKKLMIFVAAASLMSSGTVKAEGAQIDAAVESQNMTGNEADIAGAEASTKTGQDGKEVPEENVDKTIQEGLIREGDRWIYQYADGTRVKQNWKDIDGKWYYFDESGWILTGWQRIDNVWYYLEPSGARVESRWIENYYLSDDGSMAVNTWIGEYYVGSDGLRVPDYKKIQEGWVQEGSRWWYRLTDGSYPKTDWKKIEGVWYYFDGSGWMLTGWQKAGGIWYYMEGSGAMASNRWIGNYYVTGSGAMAVNTWIGEYYVGADGAWVQQMEGWVKEGNRWWYRYTNGSYPRSDWKQIEGSWYYFDGSGWMLTGWQKVGSTWYYMDASGAMASNRWIGNYYVTGSGAMAVNTWIGEYYVGADGAWVQQMEGWVKEGNRWWYRYTNGSYPRSDWKQIEGSWYYFDGSGWMLTGWQKVGSTWYYMDASGAMASNRWIGNYYVTGSGAMAVNTWIGEYYVGADGAWVQQMEGWVKEGNRWWYRYTNGSYPRSDWKQIEGSWYYFDGSGWMLTGWQKVGSTWYYMDASGAMASNRWIGNYYVTGSGAMAVNTWVGEYYVGSDGKWIPGYEEPGQSVNASVEDGPLKSVSDNKKGVWKKEGSKYWYCYTDGTYPADKWQKIDGEWYCFDSSGWMYDSAVNKYKGGSGWIGDFHVSSSGAWDYVYAKDSNGKKYVCETEYVTDPVVSDQVLWTAIVYAEAGDQGISGMSAVTMTILNRMNSSSYPNDLKVNIYKQSQFEPARTGVLTKYLKDNNSAISKNYRDNTWKAAQNALASFQAYKAGTGKRTIEGISLPAGKSEFDYIYFMTPKAFENLGLNEAECDTLILYKPNDPDKYHGHIFFNKWIKN